MPWAGESVGSFAPRPLSRRVDEALSRAERAFAITRDRVLHGQDPWSVAARAAAVRRLVLLDGMSAAEAGNAVGRDPSSIRHALRQGRHYAHRPELRAAFVLASEAP